MPNDTGIFEVAVIGPNGQFELYGEGEGICRGTHELC